MKVLRCTHCGMALEPALERCPQCLRKHTSREVEVGAGFDVVRWGFLLGAWVLCVPMAWLGVVARAWVDAQGLQLSATLFLGAVVLLPPRFAFSALLRRARWRDAAAALGMVWGLAALLAVAVGLASRLTANVPLAVLTGLLVFLAPLLIAPAVWAAQREGTSRRRALRQGVLRFVAVAAAVIALFGLKVLMAPKPRAPLAIVANPKALLAPLDLEHAPVARAWRLGADGLKQLHLRSEAEPFERSVLKLKSELINALSELDAAPDAGPVVTLWVPARFESAAGRAAIAKESDLLNAVLTKSKRKTQRGEPLRVVIAFGELPAE